MRLFILPAVGVLLAGAGASSMVVSVGHAGDPQHAVFAGDYLVTDGWSNVAIIDLASGLTVAHLPQGSIVLTLSATLKGDLVAVGHCGHAIDLIDVRSRLQVRRRISLRHECAESLSFSPDGAYLATASGGCSPGGGLQVWDVGSGRLARELATESAMRHVVFAGTGRWLAGVDTNGKATVFEWPSGRQVRTYEGLSQPGYSGSRLIASKDGQFLGWLGSGIRVWDVATGVEVALPGEQEVSVEDHPPNGPQRRWTERHVLATAAEFIDDGRLAYIDGDEMIVRRLPNGPQQVRQLAKRQTKWLGDVGISDRLSWLAIRRDGLQLAGAQQAQTVVWDVAAARIRELTAPSLSLPSSLRWSSSGIVAWIGLGSGVQGWDDRAGAPANFDNKEVVGGLALDFRADGAQLAVAGAGDLSIIEVAKPRVVRTREFPPAAGSAVAYSPDGSTLAFGFPPEGFGEFDDRLRMRQHITDLERYTRPEHVAFSPDGKWLAAGFSGPHNFLRVWPRATGRPAAAVTLDTADVTYGPRQPAFSRDSRWLASFQRGNSLVIWETGSWRATRTVTLKGTGRALAFAPQGTLLAVASDGEAAIWDAATAKRVAKLVTPGSTEMREIAWSPDGLRIVASADDGPLRFWSAADGQLLGSLYAFESSTEWLFVTPDGRLDGTEPALSRFIAWAMNDRTVVDPAATRRHRVRGLWRQIVASVRR
jgi:WD40 repeat protein